MSQPAAWPKTVTFFEDDWHDGNVPIMGARTHAAWLGTSVFDGARAFEGVTPDLDLHCARVSRAHSIGGPASFVGSSPMQRRLETYWSTPGTVSNEAIERSRMS